MVTYHKNSKSLHIWPPNYKKKVIIVSRERFALFLENRGEISVSNLGPPTPLNPPQKCVSGGAFDGSNESSILLLVYNVGRFLIFGPGVKLQAVKKSRQFENFHFLRFYFTSKYVKNTSKCVQICAVCRTNFLEAK